MGAWACLHSPSSGRSSTSRWRREWKAAAKRAGGVVAMPAQPCYSGLSPAGTALEKLLHFADGVNALVINETDVFVAIGKVAERIDF
jgi:hypothetical protein